MQDLLNLQSQRRKALPHVGIARCEPYPHAGRQRGHRGRPSVSAVTTALSVAGSTALVIRIRTPAANSISIAPQFPEGVVNGCRPGPMGTAAKRTSSSCRCSKPRLASEDACARLPPPHREQIQVNVTSARNLDDTARWRQTLFDDPELLGSAPAPSPLRTGQNRNRRHVCSFACKLTSKPSHAPAQSGKVGSRRSLTTLAQKGDTVHRFPSQSSAKRTGLRSEASAAPARGGEDAANVVPGQVEDGISCVALMTR